MIYLHEEDPTAVQAFMQPGLHCLLALRHRHAIIGSISVTLTCVPPPFPPMLPTVFDYTAASPETGVVVTKLVFVNWAPDDSSTRTKMMYASTKDFFKGFLDGVAAELQASDESELEEGEMVARVCARK
eukprot:358705-Chlamydomonas_euryale.AAC.2